MAFTENNNCVVGLYSDSRQKNRVFDYDNRMSRSITLTKSKKTIRKTGEVIEGWKGYISLDNGQSIQIFVKPKEYESKGKEKFVYADVSIYAPRDSQGSGSRFHSKHG